MDLQCEQCFELYMYDTALVDKRPYTVCENGHTMCGQCMSVASSCPTCREDRLDKPILNRALLNIVQDQARRMVHVQKINVNEINLQKPAIGSGGFAKVYKAKWHTQIVAVKVLKTAAGEKEKEALLAETSLLIGLFHPNIIKTFGTVEFTDGKLGIAMELAMLGSLDDKIDKLNQGEKIKISQGIVDGLGYLHDKKIAHRDLKPGNILVDGSPDNMTAKISDFGLSKMAQSIISNTGVVGTPTYIAPELVEETGNYSHKVDIFSLAVILFEIFSGQRALPLLGVGSNPFTVVRAMEKGKRPKIPEDMAPAIKSVIESGWAGNADERPSIDEIRKTLENEKKRSVPEEKKPEVAQSPEMNEMTIRASVQAAEVANKVMPLPAVALQWNQSLEVINSKELRKTMVENVKTKSNMAKMINGVVFNSMEAVPRHLFLEPSRLSGFIGKATFSEEEKLAAAYLYNKPIPATPETNESSPEIIGVQLSLTEIIQGHEVLLVGIKGGYIQSLVAQMVGMHGGVTTVTSKPSALQICKDRVNNYSPLNNIMKWKLVDDVSNPEHINKAFTSGEKFHTAIYCGSNSHLPVELEKIMHDNCNILAPVQLDPKNQQFQLWKKHDKGAETRKITEFGVIFEEAK